MSTKPKPGDGNVTINFDGRDWDLVPTLNAIRKISRSSEGLTGAIDRIIRLDFDTICLVMGLGMDLSEKGLEGFEERVFKEGIQQYVTPLTKYLINLSNGGRPLAVKSEADKTAENPS